MLISLNWIRDFVELPAGLSPQALGERFTLTTAEVEGVEEIRVDAKGLIAARIVELSAVEGRARGVRLDVGGGKTVETVSAAPDLNEGDVVVFAPVGASVAALGQINASEVGGRKSEGMILPGEALGIEMAVQEAVFLPRDTEPGAPLDASLFDDWVIEVDNKSITHRPDLWGHYGIAREIAAIVGAPLKPYPVVSIDDLKPEGAGTIPIDIADAERCPRYSGLVLEGVDWRPGPLWMQLRLGHIGMRPIDALVDLTNYIMAELGQPMHAFDGDKVERIEVGPAAPGSKFITLDGMERSLPDDALMILTGGKPIAVAGVMGGLESEVAKSTKRLLLESANFEPATIRRCATALGLRTEASARFEKSLDPVNTVLAIQRFVALAKDMFPEMKLVSQLSDCYPKPAVAVTVEVDPAFVARFMGHPVTADQIGEILQAIDFTVERANGKLRIGVPSFRATKDIGIEADIIEEVARFVGFGTIESRLPEVTVRCFEPNEQHAVEHDALDLFCRGLGYTELLGYLWYDAAWLRRIEYEPGECVTLKNPSAEGLERLRKNLMPGLLAAADRNRHHLDEFKLLEVGGVLPVLGADQREERHAGLILGRKGKNEDDALLSALKGDLDSWSWQAFNESVRYAAAEADAGLPWEHDQKTARASIGGLDIGRVSVLSLPFRRRIDEHLAAWSIAWAELNLSALFGRRSTVRKMAIVSAFPEVDLDFSFVVPAATFYEDIERSLSAYRHSQLRRLTYVGSYVGKSVGEGLRSLTVRARIGDTGRTLVDEDISEFQAGFEAFLGECGYELRK